MANPEPQKPSQTKTSRANPLLIAFVTIFLDLLGFGIMIPIQAFYAQEFGASPAVITLLGGSYSFMQFLFAPFWGRLSDRVGRRPIILFSVFISAMGHFIFGLAGSLTVLFLSRMLAGFGNANLGAAQAIISDSTTPENRAKGMGMIGAAFGLGFIFGPAIGGVLGQYGPNVPAFAAGFLALFNLAFAYFRLPETLKPGSKPSSHRTFSVAAFRHATRHVNVGKILTITFVYTTAFALMEQVIGLLIERVWVDPMGLTGTARISEAAKLTAYFLVVIGVTATVIQGGLIGKLSRRFGEINLSRTGLAFLALSLLAIPAVASTQVFGLMLGAAVMMAFGSGLFNPSNTSLLSRSVGADEQGGTLGLNQSVSSLGRVIGPAFSGLFFQIWPSLPFLGAAVLMIGALGVSMRLKRIESVS